MQALHQEVSGARTAEALHLPGFSIGEMGLTRRTAEDLDEAQKERRAGGDSSPRLGSVRMRQRLRVLNRNRPWSFVNLASTAKRPLALVPVQTNVLPFFAMTMSWQLTRTRRIPV